MLHLYLFHSIAIYALPSRLYGDFDLNQVLLVHSASKQHTSNKATGADVDGYGKFARLVGLVMALFKKCFGSLLLVGVVMGFFAVWGVGFLNDIKKGFAYVYTLKL